MGILQEDLDEFIAASPRFVLTPVIEKKLEEQGIVDEKLNNEIVTAILEADDSDDNIDVDLPFELEFSDADVAEIQGQMDKLKKAVPKIIEGFIEEAASGLTIEIRNRFEAERGPLLDQQNERRRKISSDWGEAFADLRLLLEACSTKGDAFNRAQIKTKKRENASKNDVLSRLHIRACRVADEIILLLENGYTEGAEARWRTLFELAVTAQLISEGGNALAERYVDHEVVENWKALNDYVRSGKSTISGKLRLDKGDRRELTNEYARIFRKYDNSFKGMYGWASEQIGIKANPQFHDLMSAADVVTSKLDFRLASFSNHASPRKLTQPMHQWDPTLHIPGSFSAGFEGPGSVTANSLMRVTSTLFPEPWNLDDLVHMRMLSKVRDSAVEKLFATAQRIDRKEQRNLDRAFRRTTVPRKK